MWSLGDNLHTGQGLLVDWFEGSFNSEEHLFVTELAENLKHGLFRAGMGGSKAGCKYRALFFKEQFTVSIGRATDGA